MTAQSAENIERQSKTGAIVSVAQFHFYRPSLQLQPDIFEIREIYLLDLLRVFHRAAIEGPDEPFVYIDPLVVLRLSSIRYIAGKTEDNRRHVLIERTVIISENDRVLIYPDWPLLFKARQHKRLSLFYLYAQRVWKNPC